MKNHLDMETAPQKTNIFIGYRRDDGGFARAVYEKLLDWFDEGAVFLDHESIDPGTLFKDELESAIGDCSVFLAVIGPHWLSDKNRARLHRPGDITRGEIRSALRHGKPIIPVLAGGAGFPSQSDLPVDIQGMGGPNALHLYDAEFRASFQKLLDKLEARYGLKPVYRRRDGSRQPFYTCGLFPSPYFADPTAKLPALHTVLAGGGRAALTAATVQGMGGVGKTLLALKYSHAFRDEYQGVWWLRAEDATLLEQDCEELCRAQDIARHDNEPHSRSVTRWLKTQPAPWLLVFDNADDPAKVRKYLPETGGHHVVFTSRNPNWNGIVKAEQQIDLQTWRDDEALEFLQSRLPNLAAEDGRRLSAALGGLPLALEMAAAYLETNDVDVVAYLTALADVAELPRLLDSGHPDNGYPHSVFAALSLAFDKLTPAARELLKLCAWFAPEPIPERVFVEHLKALSPSKSWQRWLTWLRRLFPGGASTPLGALQKAATTPNCWRETVGELKRYALCRVVEIPALGAEKGAENALLLHRLTQEAVRAKLADKAADCAAATALVGAAYPGDAQLPANWPACAALLPHVRRLLDFYPHGWVDAHPLCWLLNGAAGYLQSGAALYREAEELSRAALEIAHSTLGEEHPSSLATMNNLASTLRAQGDLSGARVLDEMALGIRRRVLGEEHPDTLTAMNNLAGTLKEQGELPGARVLQEKTLDIRCRVLGEEHFDTLTSMSTLAGTLRAQGDLPGARALEEKTLDIRCRVLGEEHPGTLTAMNNLASTLRAQGDLPGARVLQEKTLDICRRVLGEEHPDTLTAMNNLASAFSKQGDLPGARALEEKTLDIHRRLLGEEHPATLRSMNNLAATFWAQGDLPSARGLQEKTLDIHRRVLGEEHPDALRSMNNLASTLSKQGDLPGA
ncbi:MAG: tetratricopeptide repeat protein, partial [Sulfuricella sp.]|nr:tetratricopeptide repeat protein [Sulfuricella sp.]